MKLYMSERSGNAYKPRVLLEKWLALDRPTIAELACYPYVHTAPEAGIPLDAYPAVTAWIKRLEALPAWIKRI